MENLLAVFIILIAIVFLVLYILLKKNIKYMNSQLNKINNTQTNARLVILSSDKDINKLAININKTIEEKKKTEAEYKKIDRELRQAIANVSHDLRTPLTSISGYIQLICDDTIKYEEKKQYIEVIKKRAESLRLLISGFYDLSRLDSNEFDLKLSSVNLSNVLCDIIASFYNDFTSIGLEPCIDIDENTGTIIGDENAIRRVFSNLIQNMLRYGKKNVAISLKKNEGYIETIFKNDAEGLKPCDAERLFERFFTADRARNGQGTGLGLAITKRLVEKMGHIIYSEFNDAQLSIIIKWKCL